ncbi:hypothetical protein SCA6_008204 [Theobroma cacao]
MLSLAIKDFKASFILLLGISAFGLGQVNIINIKLRLRLSSMDFRSRLVADTNELLSVNCERSESEILPSGIPQHAVTDIQSSIWFPNQSADSEIFGWDFICHPKSKGLGAEKLKGVEQTMYSEEYLANSYQV